MIKSVDDVIQSYRRVKMEDIAHSLNKSRDLAICRDFLDETHFFVYTRHSSEYFIRFALSATKNMVTNFCSILEQTSRSVIL